MYWLLVAKITTSSIDKHPAKLSEFLKFLLFHCIKHCLAFVNNLHHGLKSRY